MAQAAKLQPQPWGEGPSDLVRRLLARRPAAPSAVPEPESREPEMRGSALHVDAAPSPEAAAILVLKAALRAERAEVGALQARLADLQRPRR